jgi:hypothetical protein
MFRTVSSLAFRLSLAAIVSLIAAGTTQAGTISSWQGSTAAWSLNGNWVGGAANKPTTSGTYSLVYSGTPTSTTSNNNVGAVNIDSILFSNNGSAGQTSAFTVGSSGTLSPSLTLLNGATITTTASVSGTLQDNISGNVTMSGSNIFNLGTNHLLKLTGTISGAGTLVAAPAAPA